MAAPASKTEILDVNRRYHDVAADEYDAKWGISFAANGQEQVVGKLSKLLGARPGPFARSLEIGAGTGYFSLNMLQAGVVGAATCTDISPGMLATLEANARAARARGGDRRLRRRRAAVRGRELRPRLRPRRAAPPARARALVRGVPPRAAARRDAVLRRRAVAPGRPHRRRAQARRRGGSRPPGARALRVPQGAAPQRPSDGRTGDDHHLEGQVDVHAFVPADLERHAAGRGLRARCACAARSCWRTGSAGSTARSRPARTRRGSRCRGSTTRTAATCCCRASTGACSRAACRRSSSTT